MDAYQIMQGEEVIGTAQVRREGLYYRIRCCCNLSGETLCRVLVRCGNREESLGILVPQEGSFGLETRIPVKKVGDGNLVFSLTPKHRSVDGQFVPLSPEEPFQYIAKLKGAFLEKRDGRMGVLVKEPGRG